MTELATAASNQAQQWGLRVGFDLVQVSQLQDSIRRFGDAFTHRLFTTEEIGYASQDAAVFAPRLAARFAAKEALIKALQLSEAGISWRDIEVVKLVDGDCRLELRGKAASLAREMGLCQLLLSLSHDGDYAGAVVTARFSENEIQGMN
jgi:holo-[acyl-carrier protein] synthase